VNTFVLIILSHLFLILIKVLMKLKDEYYLWLFKINIYWICILNKLYKDRLYELNPRSENLNLNGKFIILI
jgi:hypothetical protein